MDDQVEARMSRAALRRLERLEAKTPADQQSHPFHSIIACSSQEAEAKQAGMIASGEAAEGDNFFHILLVSPPLHPEAAT
jgi:hypothetical protein